MSRSIKLGALILIEKCGFPRFRTPSWLGGKHGKIYSKCMGKIGSLALDNSRKVVDIL